jgi:sodium transport system permease protein
MSLQAAAIRTLLAAELRMLLRDRRAIATSIVLPVLVMPLMLFASSWANRQRERTLAASTCRWVVSGSEAGAARAIVTAALDQAARRDAEAAPEEAAPAPGETAPATPKARARFEEAAETDARAALEAGRVHVVVEAATAAEARAAQARAGAEQAAARQERGEPEPAPPGGDAGGGGERPIDGAPALTLVYRADRDESSSAVWRLAGMLRENRNAARAEALRGRGFPVPLDEAGAVDETDLASEGQRAGSTLGRLLTLFILFLLLPGAAIVATDTLAGEKERGTLETLLTTAAGRAEIVVAKVLAVLGVTIAITLVQMGNLFVYVGLELVPLPAGLAAAVGPGVAVLLAVLFLPVAALVSGALLATSGRARTCKEAQFFFLPVFLLGLLPGLAPLLPGLPLHSPAVLVPIAGIALAVREILVGHFDWFMIAAAWLATAAAAAWTLRLTVRSLASESLVSGSGGDAAGGGSTPFERHVGRWFAALWAVLLMTSGYLGHADARLQAAVNILGLFLGTSVFLLWRYRLDPRAALALRAPRPAVWLGVLCGVPGTLLAGAGLFRLGESVFPVPTEVLEEFSRALLPDNTPLWSILVFLAVVPGVFEEIAFRGMLLHGLRRRFHPAVVVVVVGAVFGLFHMALFRLVPTAFLGMVFAAATLLTGSIYPAMVWHAASNAASLLAASAGLSLERLDTTTILAGTGVLAVSFWIFWRNRTPYPGLRPWRAPRA